MRSACRFGRFSHPGARRQQMAAVLKRLVSVPTLRPQLFWAAPGVRQHVCTPLLPWEGGSGPQLPAFLPKSAISLTPQPATSRPSSSHAVLPGSSSTFQPELIASQFLLLSVRLAKQTAPHCPPSSPANHTLSFLIWTNLCVFW